MEQKKGVFLTANFLLPVAKRISHVNYLRRLFSYALDGNFEICLNRRIIDTESSFESALSSASVTVLAKKIQPKNQNVQIRELNVKFRLKVLLISGICFQIVLSAFIACASAIVAAPYGKR